MKLNDLITVIGCDDFEVRHYDSKDMLKFDFKGNKYEWESQEVEVIKYHGSAIVKSIMLVENEKSHYNVISILVEYQKGGEK